MSTTVACLFGYYLELNYLQFFNVDYTRFFGGFFGFVSQKCASIDKKFMLRELFRIKDEILDV